MHPWARATPATATACAIHMQIENGGHHGDRLIAASTAAADRVELHNHSTENGVTTIRAVEAIEVGARATAELRPRGTHLMITGSNTSTSSAGK